MAFRYPGEVHAKVSTGIICSSFKLVEWTNVKLVAKPTLKKVSIH